MALPSPGFYTTTGGLITTHDFGSVEAGEYKPGSTGWKFRLWNDFGGSEGSDAMTSVKITIRGSSGGTDETWVQQHWVQIKSSSGSTGVVDDAMTEFQAVGKNKELSLGNIPSNHYRTLYARCYPPTDATEQDVDFQLRVTYQQPQTSICKWITGLRGNGVVATTGDPFAMSTGGSTGTIPYEAGYALIDNNEIYYGSSGSYDIETTGSGTYKIYLDELGSFNETTGSIASNELVLYEATISSGVCTDLDDKRVYLAGLQAGTTGAIPPIPDKGDLYLDTANGVLYGCKTAGTWYSMCPHTFLSLIDTPPNYSGDASKILTVTTGEDAVEFTSSTGIKLDDFGTPDDNTDLDASTGAHGLLLKRTGSTVTYLRADGTWATPTGTTGGAAMTFLNLTDTPADYTDDATKILRVNSSSGAVEFISSTGIKLDDFGTPDNNTDLNATTGYHGLLPVGDGDTTHYMAGDISWVSTTGIVLDSLTTPTTGTALNATTGRHGLLPVLSGSSGEYLNGDANFVVPQASNIEVSEIGTATYDDVQDWINNTQSGGRISGGAIADDTDGTITVSSGTGFIQTTTGDIGLTQSFDWAEDSSTGVALTDNSANYVYVDYNAGTPKLQVTTTRGNIHLGDHFTLGRVYRSGTTLHILQSGVNLYNATRRNHERLVAVRGFERDSGGVISESAVTERALTSMIGNFYLGANKITTTAQNTSTGGSDYFTTHYYIDGAWASSTGQQQVDNLQYNDITSTGLETLTAQRYGVHWAYIHFDSDINVVYGQGDYTLAQAENAVVPDSLPSFVEDFGILASKIIIQQGSTGFNSTVTAYKVLFPVSNPAEHNDLGALDTGDYQHLTQTEHDEITQWAGVVTLSTGGTIDIPTGQEYQINGSEVKLDEWATPTTGTALDSSTGRHGLLIALDGSTGNYLRGDGSWQTPPGANGGATTFLGLNDTPANYTGAGGKVVKVTTGEDALEFIALTVFHETFMDVRIANSSGIHAAIAGSTSSEQEITTNITNPDIPRNTSITVTQNATPSGNITLYGTFANGTTGNEAITISTGGTSYGNKAFGKVNKFIIPITVSSGDTVSVGWSDKIGLCNSFSSSGSVFKVKKNAVDTSTGIAGNVNTTYNTLNLATIADYDDYEIWYKQ